MGVNFVRYLNKNIFFAIIIPKGTIWTNDQRQIILQRVTRLIYRQKANLRMIELNLMFNYVKLLLHK